MLKENIRAMDVSKTSVGMDIVIVCCQNEEQEHYWQKRLKQTTGSIVKPSAIVIVVQEDWAGGAGNGLGSLYAYQKAREKGYIEYKIDIFQKQREGHSVALYHTAGEGRRLYPLTASEYGNKSAVVLPSLVKLDDHEEPLTLLEATIKQTSIYAPFRKGRLSVFWADQIFIPANNPDYTSRHHADILVKLMPMPTEEEWTLKELDKYGLITLNKQGQAQNIDKTTYSTLKKLISSGKMSIAGGLAVSLGSFSLSTPLTFALIQEFQPELIQKNVKMDSDPFFWMPFTLDQQSYIDIMVLKGSSPEEAKNHHLRMQYFKNHFLHKYPDASLFGIVDIGVGSFWWDFGTVENYMHNILKITQNTVEGYLLREFFLLEQNFNSTILKSHIGKGKITSSVVIDCCAEELNVDHCVIIGSVFKEMSATNSLFYKVMEEENIHFPDKTVRADVWLASKKELLKVYAERLQDTKKLWNVKLQKNVDSYEKIAEKVNEEKREFSEKEFTQQKLPFQNLMSITF